jgi:8-hydroxy-5-deazaflavin:NADPH oxidoreductase
MTTPLTIAVAGTGNIGGTLGRAFARAGHRVVFGSRDPGAADVAGDTSARVAPLAEALEGADVVVLAVPGGAVAGLVAEHAAALSGALVVDAANSIGGDGPADHHDVITAAAPGARYARAFNSLGWENFADPRFGDEVADLFFSAPEEDQATVAALIEAVGLRPVYLGEGQHAVVDGVLRLWFALAVGRQRGRHLAFRVLT